MIARFRDGRPKENGAGPFSRNQRRSEAMREPILWLQVLVEEITHALTAPN